MSAEETLEAWALGGGVPPVTAYDRDRYNRQRCVWSCKCLRRWCSLTLLPDDGVEAAISVGVLPDVTPAVHQKWSYDAETQTFKRKFPKTAAPWALVEFKRAVPAIRSHQCQAK